MKIRLASLLFFLGITSFSQVFTTLPGIFISSLTTVNSTITVSGVGEISCTYGLTDVCINVSHTFDADLDITLTDPMGNVYLLTSDNGGSGNNYTVTCFSMAAATPVTAGSAPFNGSYIPEGDIGAANNGQNANGNWTLSVTDDALGGVGVLNGWQLVFGDTPNCPTVTAEDCGGGTTLCSDATLTGNSAGSGNVSDLVPSNDGCLNGENESSWYYFQAATDGTYAFEIITLVDYDFAVWGPLPGVVCPPNAPPIRCSYSGTLGRTGLASGAGDLSEGEFGDAFVEPITASAGDVFIIVIDNFTADGTTFDLEFTLGAGGSLDCTPLPIELESFNAEPLQNANELKWVTASEINNAFFTIERSTDGENWTIIQAQSAIGNSSTKTTYSYTDYTCQQTLNYYRLSQTDMDGNETKLKTISLDNRTDKKLLQLVNVMGQPVTEDYEGVKICVYSDGSIRKIVGH